MLGFSIDDGKICITPNQKNLNDRYLISEIERIKNETNELKDLLVQRTEQIDQLEETVDNCGVDSNVLMKKIKTEIDKLYDRVEELEEAVTDTINRNNQNTAEKMTAIPDMIEDKYKIIKKDLSSKLETLENGLIDSAESTAEVKEAVETMKSMLEDKADKKDVFSLRAKLSTMFVIGVADFVGTIMTLILLCYLIISLAG